MSWKQRLSWESLYILHLYWINYYFYWKMKGIHAGLFMVELLYEISLGTLWNGTFWSYLINFLSDMLERILIPLMLCDPWSCPCPFLFWNVLEMAVEVGQSINPIVFLKKKSYAFHDFFREDSHKKCFWMVEPLRGEGVKSTEPLFSMNDF